MDSGPILTIILGVSAGIGLLLVLRSRKKGGQKKVQELCQHLQGIGIKASVLEQNNKQEKVEQKRSWTQKAVGTTKLTGRNTDLINVIGMASQYGVNYFIDYLLKISSFMGGEKRKKTKMVRKKTSAFRSKLVDVKWRGDDSLAQKLNLDYQLKDKLLQADLGALKGDIGIFPELKYEYARIRTDYFLPTSELFEVIDIIANHIRSE